MDARKNALVLGIHSFVDSPLKVGIQYIAQGLARSGWRVDYLSIFSSPFDIYGRQRHRRLKRVWLKHQDRRGIDICQGLTEYALRAPFPAHQIFLRYDWQQRWISRFAPGWLGRRRYRLCVHDVTANILYLSSVRADFTVLRLNDLPEGFGHTLSSQIIDRITASIRSASYHDVWSAHAPLSAYVKRLNTANRVCTILNGVDDRFLQPVHDHRRQSNTAVYIGSIDQRVDLELMDKTAALLPDWRFDIVGPLNRPWTVRSTNIRRLAPISGAGAREMLSHYQVGVIPFRDTSGLIAYMDRPLKLFEYIGCGLGVACTDVGSLKQGIGGLASFGNDPNQFADAIRREAKRAENRSFQTCRDMIAPYAWSNVMNQIHSRIALLGHRP